MTDQLTPFQAATQRTSAAIYSGLDLTSTTYPDDPVAAAEAAWIDIQSLYVFGLAASVLPEGFEPFEQIEDAEDFGTLARRLRQCEQDLTAAFPDPWTRDELGYLTLITEYASKLETYANRFA